MQTLTISFCNKDTGKTFCIQGSHKILKNTFGAKRSIYICQKNILKKCPPIHNIIEKKKNCFSFKIIFEALILLCLFAINAYSCHVECSNNTRMGFNRQAIRV